MLHPVSIDVQRAVKQQQIAACRAKLIKEKELTAQEWFEKGYKEESSDDQFYCYIKAIQLQPDYAEAYNNRGNVYRATGN